MLETQSMLTSSRRCVLGSLTRQGTMTWWPNGLSIWGIGEGRARASQDGLPASTAAAAAHNVALLLPTAAPKVSLPISVSMLSIMSADIPQRGLQAPVNTDEMRDQLGEVETLLVVSCSKTDIIGTAASSVGAITASGAKDVPVSAETQAWLLSKEAHEVEANFRDAIHHKLYCRGGLL